MGDEVANRGDRRAERTASKDAVGKHSQQPAGGGENPLAMVGPELQLVDPKQRRRRKHATPLAVEAAFAYTFGVDARGALGCDPTRPG